MKKAAIYIVFALLLAATACKKCYTCTQRCAYCVPQGHTGIAIKVCATGTGGHLRVDSLMKAFKDSSYTCNDLTDQLDVCDKKNLADDAAAYYEKQDYYCAEKAN